VDGVRDHGTILGEKSDGIIWLTVRNSPRQIIRSKGHMAKSPVVRHRHLFTFDGLKSSQ